MGLATGPEDIRFRLPSAVRAFGRLAEREIPHDLLGDVREIRYRLNRYALVDHHDGKGTVKLGGMQKRTGVAIARLICKTYSELAARCAN